MKLQGVIILRVTDLRRFFDLTEFWEQRNDFVEMIKQGWLNVFCDTEDERELCLTIRRWILGHREDCFHSSIKEEIKDNSLSLSGFTDETNKSFPLGKLKKFVEQYKNVISSKDLIGLVALYLLLGADKTDCAIEPEISIFPNKISVEQLVEKDDEYIPLHGDCEFKSITEPVYPFARKVIANVSDKDVNVKCGTSLVTLSPKECVVALFCNSNQCYKIFPHIAADYNKSLELRMKIDMFTKRPYMVIKVNGTEKSVANVYSIAIEDGKFPVYVEGQGKLNYDVAKCFKLNSKYNHFKENTSDSKILAFERSVNGCFVFYTKEGKTEIY